jgi:hypothetical protein
MPDPICVVPAKVAKESNENDITGILTGIITLNFATVNTALNHFNFNLT